MDEKTLDALKASIQHWRDVVDHPLSTDVGIKDCALCDLFHPCHPCHQLFLDWDLGCVGCPVGQKTGKPLCRGTSYNNFVELFSYGDDDDVDEDVARAKATEMLSFLEGLLPPGEVA